MPTPVDCLIEAGSRRTFASAVAWPGWCRAGRDEDGVAGRRGVHRLLDGLTGADEVGLVDGAGGGRTESCSDQCCGAR